MKKAKLHAASKSLLNAPKLTFAKSPSEKQLNKTSVIAFGKGSRVLDSVREVTAPLTSRATNKENQVKREQNMPLKSCRTSYTCLHEQKPSYMSQSLVQINESMRESISRVEGGAKESTALSNVRNQLISLLQEDRQDLESATEDDFHNMIDQMVAEAIIESQANQIRQLTEEVERNKDKDEEISTLKAQMECFKEKVDVLTERLFAKDMEKSNLLLEGQLETVRKEVEFLSKQNESLRKDVATVRKQNTISKKEMASIKKTLQHNQISLAETEAQLQTTSQQLKVKSIWLSTMEFQNTQLSKQLKPNQLITEVLEENHRLRECIFGLNKSNDYLLTKLHSIKRHHQLEIQESNRKHQAEIKKIRERIRKSVKPPRRRNLRIEVESDDSIDWNLEEEAK